MEGIPCVLTSATPSTETFLNVLIKKYAFWEGTKATTPVPVQLVKKTRNYLSRTITYEIREFLRQNGTVLVLEPKHGYGLLHCSECDHILRCPHCDRPLTFHKKDKPLLLCHFCAFMQSVPETCPFCKGFSLEVIGHGIERTEQALRGLFQGLQLIETETPCLEPGILYIGPLRSYRITTQVKTLLVMLNTDMFLNIPEFRPAERLFQEVFYLATQLPSGSRVVLQSARPSEAFYRFLRRWDYMGFLKTELHLRKSMKLPPFKRLIHLTVHLRSEARAEDVKGLLMTYLNDLNPQGPILAGSALKGYRTILRYVLQGRTRTRLRQRLQVLERELSRFRALLRVDVDPYEV